MAGSTVVATYYVPTVEDEDDGVYGYDLADGSEQRQFTHPDVDVRDVRDGFVLSGETIYVTGGETIQALRSETEPEDDGEDERAAFERPDGVAWSHDGPTTSTRPWATGTRRRDRHRLLRTRGRRERGRRRGPTDGIRPGLG